MSNGSDRSFFNISIDTGILVTMLITGVWFGAAMRSDVNNAIDRIAGIESKLGQVLTLNVKITELETRLNAVERAVMRD